jgi:hypothetical protein
MARLTCIRGVQAVPLRHDSPGRSVTDRLMISLTSEVIRCLRGVQLPVRYLRDQALASRYLQQQAIPIRSLCDPFKRRTRLGQGRSIQIPTWQRPWPEVQEAQVHQAQVQEAQVREMGVREMRVREVRVQGVQQYSCFCFGIAKLPQGQIRFDNAGNQGRVFRSAGFPQ